MAAAHLFETLQTALVPRGGAGAVSHGMLVLRLSGAAAAVQSAATQLGGERAGDVRGTTPSELLVGAADERRVGVAVRRGRLGRGFHCRGWRPE